MEITRSDNNTETMTPEQVAAELHIPVSSVWRLAREGKLPCFRLGERLLRFNRNVLAEWQRAQMSADAK